MRILAMPAGRLIKVRINGHQSSDKDCPIAVFLKPVVGPIEVMRCNEDVFPVFIEKWPSAFYAHA